jgi:hypothetical protein
MRTPKETLVAFNAECCPLPNLWEFSILRHMRSWMPKEGPLGACKRPIMSKLDAVLAAAPLQLAIPARILRCGIHFGGRYV